ncbi:S41 family peptidase [Dactylosporangium sp. CS-033363]|uniref:S41 family peptidase n=1 Tax=Dactylosporangium sp. CS-033363 TaxID=3239935 RepID=UPI003D8DCC11
MRTWRVRRYLTHALDLMESSALFRAELDWPAVRADAASRCAGARTFADTHAVLSEVLRRAGGAHSGLRAPGRPSTMPDPQPPAGGLVDGTVAWVRLPGSGHKEYKRIGSSLVRDLAAAAPTGWIVDLRGNRGGNMWPMLAVLAPLLPEGVLGYFVPPGGAEQAWTLDAGRIRLAGRELARAQRPPVRTPGRPLAVLTDGKTASSGEAVAVALRGRPDVRVFGAPTEGFTSANETHRLRDGARLYLTVAWFADHRRTVYRGPLPVDDPGGADPLTAAAAWLAAA